jgi:hypothetical protein
MTTLELVKALEDFGIKEGFAIREGKIVLWENKTEIPKELTEFIKLDGVANNGNDN